MHSGDWENKAASRLMIVWLSSQEKEKRYCAGHQEEEKKQKERKKDPRAFHFLALLLESNCC
jgi:hypothetical protein